MDGPEVCNWNNFDEYMHGPEVCNWNNFDGYMHGPEVCNWNNFDGYMHGPEVCNLNNFDGYMHGPEVCNWNNFDGYMHEPEVCNLNNFDGYMDGSEVCNSMNELENGAKSYTKKNENGAKSEGLSISRSQQGANNWIFHKVPYMMRQVNEKAYVPRVISIGPYHYGKEHLKAMEDVKKIYFRTLTGEVKPDRYVDAMMMEVKAIRKYYEGPLDPLDHMGSKAFAEMLVFDGCFILQLLVNGFDPPIEVIHQVNIRYDLLLLENQLPFDMLLKLYSMMRNDGQQEIKEKLHGGACSFFKGGVLGQNIDPDRRGDKKRYPHYHLLGLVYDSWLSSQEIEVDEDDYESKTEEDEDEDEYESKIEVDVDDFKTEVDELEIPKAEGIAPPPPPTKAERTKAAGIAPPPPEVKGLRKFISCATDLERAGINFKKKSECNTHLLDIDFADDAKELRIPKLVVNDNTEVILRNMMAYEQFIITDRPNLVCDYATFMDNLIDSGEDVKILRDADVIENWLGDDKAVAEMFNKLRDFTYVSTCFRYEDISKAVNKHCRKRRYKWLATLKRDYFNSPWSIIALLAAVLALVLTLTQTVFSVLSNGNQ